MNIKDHYRYDWVDDLKGLAMCLVIFGHCERSELPNLLQQLGKHGQSGVQLFFLLSAFLTFMSLDRYFEKHDFKMVEILRWYRDKLLRIIPLYYLALFIIATLTGGSSYGLGDEGSISVLNMIAHILFVNGLFPHYIDSIIGTEWYIAVLVLFYFLSPFFYKWINNSFVKAISLFIFFAFLGRAIGVIGNREWCRDSYIYINYFDKFSLTAQLPIMCIGILLFLLFKNRESLRLSELSAYEKKLLSYSLILFTGVMVIGQVRFINRIMLVSQYTLFGIWFSLLIVSVWINDIPLIENPIFRVIGKYSFPIYLFHYFFIQLWENNVGRAFGNGIIDWVVKYLCIIGISLFVGMVLTRFYDKPIKDAIKKHMTPI